MIKRLLALPALALALATVVRIGAAGELSPSQALPPLGVLADLAGDAETLVVNGRTVHVSSATADGDVATILERAATGCSGVSHRTSFDATCISRDRKLARVSARLLPPSAGGPSRVHVVTGWTEGPVDPSAFIAGDRDAPGTDSAIAARPLGSRRVLTASVAGKPYALRVYATPSSPRDAVTEIDASLVAHGLARATRTDDAPARAGGTWFRDGTDVLVFAERDPEGTLVSILEVRSQ